MRIHPRGGILAALAVVLVTLGVAAGVSAAGPTLRIEPASQTVAKGASFTVRVVTNAVPTSGAQATVTFDQTKVQITSVTRGAPHAIAPFFLGAGAPAIASANTAGSLDTVATTFLPPDAVPAGDADFLIIGFTAIACGDSSLGLPVGAKGAVLLDGRPDTYGLEVLPVTTTGGKVTIPCSGASPSPAASGASATPTASGATPTPAASGATPTASGATPTQTGAVEGVVGGPSSTAPPTDTLSVQTEPTSGLWPLVLGVLAAIIAILLLETLPQVVRRRR